MADFPAEHVVNYMFPNDKLAARDRIDGVRGSDRIRTLP